MTAPHPTDCRCLACELAVTMPAEHTCQTVTWRNPAQATEQCARCSYLAERAAR